MTHDEAQALLRQMLVAAIAAADPAVVLAHHLPEPPKGRCIVLGAGKAAAAMALAVEKAWPDVDLGGVVVTRYGHAVPTRRIKVLEASHPVPDTAGEAAAREIYAAAQAAGPDDLVLVLISGGGSALMPLPVSPLRLADKQAVNRLLLRSGLAIDEMNKVRRRLSCIKGGGLARAAAPARVVTLAISDVPGDDPAAIASGPTVPDPTESADLSGIVAALGPTLPDTVRDILLRDPQQEPPFDADYRLIATPMMALQAAAKVAEAHGVTPLILGDALEGEARELGTIMAGIAVSAATHSVPIKAPAVLLSGGETTVTISGTAGRGGRNTEFLLSMLVSLEGHPAIHAIAADTDGIDGTEDAAGAAISPQTLAACATANIDPATHLRNHDSYPLFDTLGHLIRTGPTLTNVNDFRAVLIL
ncbi:hydroxypyruvate reductase [Sulfitobacter brevis]|uniref:Hydroxypyruvate reductase n=1 Tax=Sulfitobacter brevis TaxID=74348 RepID=A0A1I2CME8_9RHOB|nr:glycerate kinase [Sulfitobacter brevis]SFE69507.1 hydroxypyruvate reductase [Sulfitobacter brevis]